eukprot:scaffold2573_cov202-Ochromonas_danica.AAC.6
MAEVMCPEVTLKTMENSTGRLILSGNANGVVLPGIGASCSRGKQVALPRCRCPMLEWALEVVRNN